MEFALLWIESLALALLFTAIIYAVSARLKNRFWRLLSRLPAFLFPTLLGGFFFVMRLADG